jgi:cell pole-organizing protein PopZ
MAAVAPQSTPQQPRSAEPSMEEILASIRKIIAEDQKALDAKAGEVVAPALEAAPAVNDDDADVLDLASLRPAPPAAPAALAEAVVVAPPPAVEPVVAEAVAAPEAEIAAAPAIAAPASPQPQAERLISDTTASTTTAAFSSLANAVFTQQARTMDDLVTEMLRPMLTAWLDDHLPALVERLVKAEIERVARGGR